MTGPSVHTVSKIRNNTSRRVQQQPNSCCLNAIHLACRPGRRSAATCNVGAEASRDEFRRSYEPQAHRESHSTVADLVVVGKRQGRTLLSR
jgi:hypothetical protein